MPTDFPRRVYEIVKRIPPGRVTTFGRIGRALGAPRSARMVGWALNHTPANEHVPAHRVVNRNGVLTGAHHFGHPDVMRGLLEDEGVAFIDEITVDLGAHVWDPADEPELDSLFVMPDEGEGVG
jgi:methylated-DNA-protein-cysteine methyltransferase related protein